MTVPDRTRAQRPWRLLQGLSQVLILLLAATPAGAAQLRLGSVLGDAAGDFLRAEQPRAFEFPSDHGPHPGFRSEWWYLTASLESPNGDAYGVQFTLFRQALRPRPVVAGPWDATQIYLGHLALTDVRGGRHLHDERLSRGHPRVAGVTAAPFAALVDGWRLSGVEQGLDVLRLDAATASFGVQLNFEALKPLVRQGDRGLSAKGPGQASYYYSLPRLAAAGEIRLGDAVVRVAGTAWLDREWSTSVLSEAQRGWDWFALQLESGIDLMAFQLRRDDGLRDPYDQGVWVRADGTAHQLRSRDFELLPLRRWKDEHGVTWPVAWELAVMGPEGPRRLRIEAALDDQRMDTLLTYWEGLVRVFDESGERIGTGYMELTGYE